MATALHPCAAAVALAPSGDHSAFSPLNSSSYSASDSVRASIRRVEASSTMGAPLLGLRSHTPQCSLRQHSLSSPCASPPSSTLSLDSKRQDVFSGCFSRRALLAHVASPDALPSCSSRPSQRGGCGAARMSFSSFSDDRAYENDEYIEAHVIEAVRMVPAREHLYMTMADGSEVEVEHVNPSAGRLLYLNSMPTIFLRMADSTNLLLPIVVGDLAIGFLMKAFKRDGNARPNYYDLMNELAQSLMSEVKHVKITQRVGDTYYARIYLAKPGTSGLVSVDARPSDAVNLAVRAQVPIFVARAIVHNDAVRVVYDPAKHGPAQPRKFILESQMDRGTSGPDDVLQEIALIRNMKSAAEEERYADAARLRDELTVLRMKSGKTQLNKQL